MVQPQWKKFGSFSKKETELPYGPAVPLLRIYLPKIESRVLKRCPYTQAHSSTVNNSQKGETPHVSTDGGMDVHGVVHPCNGMLPAFKKGGCPDTHHDTNGP